MVDINKVVSERNKPSTNPIILDFLVVKTDYICLVSKNQNSQKLN